MSESFSCKEFGVIEPNIDKDHPVHVINPWHIICENEDGRHRYCSFPNRQQAFKFFTELYENLYPPGVSKCGEYLNNGQFRFWPGSCEFYLFKVEVYITNILGSEALWEKQETVPVAAYLIKETYAYSDSPVDMGYRQRQEQDCGSYTNPKNIPHIVVAHCRSPGHNRGFLPINACIVTLEDGLGGYDVSIGHFTILPESTAPLVHMPHLIRPATEEETRMKALCKELERDIAKSKGLEPLADEEPLAKEWGPS